MRDYIYVLLTGHITIRQFLSKVGIYNKFGGRTTEYNGKLQPLNLKISEPELQSHFCAKKVLF